MKKRNTRVRLWSLLVIVAAGLAAACTGEAPVGPPQNSGAALDIADAPASSHGTNGGQNLDACQNLEVPDGSKFVRRLYADGVQIYTWNGASWTFVAPSAVLSADPAGRSIVGTHYAGPTWESRSGGTVVGSVLDRCTPDPDDIPWLLLGTVADGPGLFHRVTHIQRVNTVGGNAPSAPGTHVGEEARVPYTSDYLFYRSK